MHFTHASHTSGPHSISIINDAFGCNVPTLKNTRKAYSCTCSIIFRLLMQPPISTPYSIVEFTIALTSFLNMPTPTSPTSALHLFSQALSAPSCSSFLYTCTSQMGSIWICQITTPNFTCFEQPRKVGTCVCGEGVGDFTPKYVSN